MCVFCTARRIAMMLPWLVIPLIGMWALSQLLPIRFRVEITSPRLACVAVLLITLLWYEVLMPKLSAWTDRRNAWLSEKKRLEAIEIQKVKKTATRRCRNCFTVYKDQNPCGGRFMCAYCGHFSKRPVLDMPLGTGMNSLNGKSGSHNGWICNGRDNIENDKLIGEFLPVKSVYWRNEEGEVCGLKDSCTNGISYSYDVNFACKLLRSTLSSVWWVWRKIFRVGLSDDNISVDKQHARSRTKKNENGIIFQESKSDKARRKAEEKRQARLEKEKLEEDERKQREEVARLVEERRKIRDEIEKVSVKHYDSVKERQKKEAEKKRQGKNRESDKEFCKINSDVEDLERKLRESVQQSEHERKDDTNKCAEMNSRKGSPVQTKGVTSSYSKGNNGTRYLDRVRGTFLSSSKVFSRGSFFSRSASDHPSVFKENRSGALMDHSQTLANQKCTSHPDHSIGSIGLSGSDKHIYKTVLSDPPSTTGHKKSWGQLFSCSSTVVPSATSNVISRPHLKDNLQNPLPAQPLPSQSQSFDSPLDFGLPSPFTLPAFPKVSTNTCSGFQSPAEYIFPLTEKSPLKLLPEEPEIFEDPCYIPAPCEAFRPSPIEPPLSRLKVHDNRNTHSNWPTKSRNATNMNFLHNNDSISVNENGTWQMWNSPPLVENGMISGPLNWYLSDDSTKEENVQQPSLQSMGLLFSNNSHLISGSNSPVKEISHGSQSGDDVTSPFLSPGEGVTLLEKAFSPRLSDSDNQLVVSVQYDVNQSGVTLGSRGDSANNSLYDHLPVDSWSKNQGGACESGENLSNSYTKPSVGSLYSNPAEQSLWSV